MFNVCVLASGLLDMQTSLIGELIYPMRLIDESIVVQFYHMRMMSKRTLKSSKEEFMKDFLEAIMLNVIRRQQMSNNKLFYHLLGILNYGWSSARYDKKSSII